MKQDLEVVIVDAMAEPLLAMQAKLDALEAKLAELVDKAVAAKPIPPFVLPPAWVEGKRWPAGVHVRHLGGLFYAQRDTEGEPARDDAWVPWLVGLAGMDIRWVDERKHVATVRLSDGRIIHDEHEVAVPIVRGYWAAEATYMPGDRVFRFGEHHCLKMSLGVDPTGDSADGFWIKVGGKYARDVGRLDALVARQVEQKLPAEVQKQLDAGFAKALAKQAA